MKKIKLLSAVIVLTALAFSAFAPIEHGIHVALLKNKKLVIQIVPDKTYENVVVHVNFYSKDNKRVGQEAYSLSDKDKYVRKDVVTNRVFKFSFDNVDRVTVDYVNEGEELGKEGGAKGKKLNIPISKTALGPVED
jgi:hypothetical protein